MNERPNGDYRIQRLTRPGDARLPDYPRPAFWLVSSNFYILATCAAFAFFFLLWGVFHEEDDEISLIGAGIAAVVMMVGAVIAREIYLRKARNQYLSAEKKFSYKLKKLQGSTTRDREENKLTLERNAAIVKDIQRKSDAARTLAKLSSGHLEVFEICNEYLSINEKQMETVKVGSPRLAGLRRGREIVSEIHRYHLLSWAEIESRSLTQKAKNYATISERLNTAQEALTVLDSALRFYPTEPRLTESESALKDFIASIKVSHWIEQAERAAFKGNYKRAISLYRDALFFLAREDVKTEEREVVAEKINSEIAALRELSASKKLK